MAEQAEEASCNIGYCPSLGRRADFERITAKGGEFTKPPTEVTGSTIALVNDTCGNLIQITQLAKWGRT